MRPKTNLANDNRVQLIKGWVSISMFKISNFFICKRTDNKPNPSVTGHHFLISLKHLNTDLVNTNSESQWAITAAHTHTDTLPGKTTWYELVLGKHTGMTSIPLWTKSACLIISWLSLVPKCQQTLICFIIRRFQYERLQLSLLGLKGAIPDFTLV